MKSRMGPLFFDHMSIVDDIVNEVSLLCNSSGPADIIQFEKNLFL